MRKVLIASLVFVSGIAILRMGVEAQNPTVSLPFLVVKDSMGVVVGPVVQLDESWRHPSAESLARGSTHQSQLPVVLFRDSTDGDAPFFVQFGKDTFWMKDVSELYFSASGCTGIPYIRATEEATAAPGVVRMRGTSYARGPNAVIYRFTQGGTQTSFPFGGSKFLPGDSSFFYCSQLNGTYGLVEAIPVMDLSHLVPPFTVE